MISSNYDFKYNLRGTHSLVLVTRRKSPWNKVTTVMFVFWRRKSQLSLKLARRRKTCLVVGAQTYLSKMILQPYLLSLPSTDVTTHL